MKSRSLLLLIAAFVCLTMTVVYRAASAPDGVNPPHAKDTDGNVIPESSATQPAKPIIFALDIQPNKDNYGPLINPDAAFDHAKHSTDAKHSLDGVTVTTCVYCHHTEQPSASGGEPYLKTFKRTAVLTAAQLDSSKDTVKDCRTCHFQKCTPAGDCPPASIIYPPKYARILHQRESSDLTNENAYHIRCIKCHDAAKQRDAASKAPNKCEACHTIKTASAGDVTPSPGTSPTTVSTPAMASTPTATPTETPAGTPTATPAS